MKVSSQLLLVCLLALGVSGCFESKQEISLNPDGSGKLVLQVLFDPSAISMGQQKKGKEQEARDAVKKILESAKGIEVWKDVSYKRTENGRISFVGTAYFSDLSKVKIQNYGTDFLLKKEGNTLTVELAEEDDKNKSRASAIPEELTEEQITQRIAEARSEWQRSKPMMTAMLSGLKKESTIQLPGKLAEINNFTKVSDNTVKVIIDGAKMIEALDSMMADDALMQAEVRSGSFEKESDGPPIGKGLSKKMFGQEGTVFAKAQTGSKPLFNYKKEVEVATKAYPKLQESLGIFSNISPGSVAKEGLIFAAGDIGDTRRAGKYSGNMEMELVMSGAMVGNARGFRSLTVNRAVDDAGTDLIEDAESSSDKEWKLITPTSYHQSSFGLDTESAGMVKQTLRLKNPARSAMNIKELSGSVEIYVSDRDPKAKIIIKNFMKSTGKNLPSDGLKKAKVELMIVNKTQFAAAQGREGQELNESDPLSGALSSGFLQLEENDLLFLVSDPAGAVVDIEVLDSTGKPVPVNPQSRSGYAYVVRFESLPAENAQLAVYLLTPKSLVQAPFTLTNIQLP